MDSESRRLPGIVRRSAVAAAVRDGGLYRSASAQGVDAGRRPPGVARLRPEGAEGPVSREINRGQETRGRRGLNAVGPHIEAVWTHLRHNWMDAVLAAGFVAVIVLSAYALLRS
jgi:hypothetical protein